MPHRGKKVRRRKTVRVKTKKSHHTDVRPKLGKPKLPTILDDSPKKEEYKNANSKKQPKVIHDQTKTKSEKEITDSRFLKKEGRIIIRNLPFKVTEDSLRAHLENFGQIEEINILRKPDGKLVGCGFVQFTSKKSAEKAIAECNATPFLGRTIILDWAVPKDVFKKAYKAPKKDADPGEGEGKESSIKQMSADKDVDEDVEKSTDDEHHSSNEMSQSEDNMDEWKKNTKGKKKDKFHHEKSSKGAVSNDLEEKCTVFLKNVSFQTTSEELNEFMEKFGPVVYALICVDPLTEHSKGTAFVKFKSEECASACLSAESDELFLDCSKMVAVPAVTREEAKRRIDELKQKTPKDGRNLYLVKEGVITAGSKAASGVSVSDMSKRVKLDQWKTQVLKNLNMFVSRYRLAVHNLPPDFTDQQLRRLFQKNAGPEAVIKEAKVMRDLKNVDQNGLGQSKGYGFVSFTKHEHALQALRNINNHPDILTPVQRPIVGFSIENRAILNARQKRLLKSQAMNPLYQGSRNKGSANNKSNQGHSRKNQCVDKEELPEEAVPNFGGLTGKVGTNKMRSRNKLQNQLKTHVENVKKLKQKKKAQVQQTKIRQVSDARMQPRLEKKLKRKINVEDESFTNLVKKYKQQLTSNVHKWYE